MPTPAARALEAALVAALAALACAPASANTCVTHAADFVEPALMSSPLHTVQPCAEIVGHMARFALATRYGVQVVDSVELLEIRIDELPAIEALDRTNAALLGVRAAGDEARARGDAVANVARHPIRVVRGLPSGVLRFFSRRYDAIAGRLGKLGGRARDELTDADASFERPSARPGVTAARGDGKSRSLAARAGREARRQALDYVSYQSTRRKWARKLKIDPYTTNPLLRERLDALAWAAVAGEQAAELAFATLPGSVLDALGTAEDVNDYVLDTPPDDVKRRNLAQLASLGCGEVEAKRLVTRGPLSLPLQTRLVDALAAIEPASGCVDVIDLAYAVRGEIEARYLVNAVGLLADAARDERAARAALAARAATRSGSAPTAAPRQHLALAGTAVVLRTDDAPIDAARYDAPLSAAAPITLPLAVDRLEWTPSTRAFFDAPALRVEHKTVIVSGELSPLARRGLSRRGWNLVERCCSA